MSTDAIPIATAETVNPARFNASDLELIEQGGTLVRNLRWHLLAGDGTIRALEPGRLYRDEDAGALYETPAVNAHGRAIA